MSASKSPINPKTPARSASYPVTATVAKLVDFARVEAGAWSLTSLREKLIKIGAKVVSHGRYVIFQMAEVAVSRLIFADILSLIARLRAPPAPA